MKNLIQLFLACFCLIFSSKTFAQQEKTMFIFGHSLIVHDPPTIPTPSNETTVPHWLHFLAEDANNSVKISGEYGFLPNHENRTVNSTVWAQWNFDHVTQAWDSDNENFSEIDFDAVLLTAANFVQYKPSNENYDGPNSHTSPLASTLTILDWVNNQKPNAVQYIYENWPNMNGLILTEDGEFPPSEAEFAKYHEVTLGSFHDWWIDYHDFVQTARPSENVRMIPVGPIISKILTQTPLSDIPVETLYEDKAPHGRPTIYFLASLITYMAIYEEKAPASYVVPNTVSSLVSNNYQSTVDFIWDELLAFNDSTGKSRVFANSVLSVASNNYQEDISVYPNPSKDFINIKSDKENYETYLFDIKGVKLNVKEDKINHTMDISNLTNGIYFLRINHGKNYITKQIVKH
ncbi:T9SS type A sorting domain-containing protein [Flavivirga abyssicola]|uniref:T9SS type A sorting domain-containing protein n=1 Tax=Flavivirga abyssicola TaxID=3063533 RepID=UPI0026DEED41|nr:T9SS type A sorting domain-containing protein [Flavivirga sp. MEBiC07777]WVK12703.1 T9SS type A sorting domain-containing protein [Flavivirga sp. MEBiC07777]